MDLSGQTLLGKYEIEGLLGQGGMGAVWRARHALTGRKLAIKVLDESYVGNKQVTRRFMREARAASVVEHPGIVEVLDIDETQDGLPFLVMELLEGETLARRIERRGRLAQDEMVRLGAMLLEALEAAHAQRVIHRDLKPENIFVVPAGRRGEIVKILDFGISHMVEEGASKLTMTGSVLGTPHYMSPEQAMGETEVDHRADLYAAGVVLYECVVGDVPFDAPNYNKLLRRILDEVPQTPRERGAEISESVERVILWAMDKERARRLGSAREMLEWLKKADAGEAVPYERKARSSDIEISISGLSVDTETQPELPEPSEVKWEISEELRSGIDNPRPRSAELEVPARLRPVATEELEIDEDALRPSISRFPPSSSSSSGQHLALPDPPAATKARSDPPPTSGLNPIPERLANLSGSYERQPPAVEPSERPAWQRYLLFGLLAVSLFAGAVFLVRWVVRPGPEPLPVAPLVEPDPEPREAPAEPRWVSLTIVGLPPQSHVELDGLPASSPMRLRRGSEHVVVITADGYEGRRLEITADRNHTINARLRPAVGTVQAPP